MKEQYIVTVNRPKGVSIREMIEYIADAVCIWGGQFHPGFPVV